MRDWERRIAERYPYAFPQGGMGFAVGDGWAGVLEEAFRRIDTVLGDDWKDGAFRVTDIKEKFGGLRVATTGPDEVDRVLDWAEEVCLRTCEICGGAGRMRRGGWLAVRCDDHIEV